MTCKTISDANPDVAGIGVILAFGSQALISLLLSATARFLLSKYFPLRGQDRKTLWRKIREDLGGSSPFSWRSCRDAWRTARTTEEGLTSTRIKKTTEAIHSSFLDSIKGHVDVSRGLSDEDHKILKGLGLGRFADSVGGELVAESRRTHIRSKYSRDITKAEEKVQELLCKVLLVASDAQTMTGIALIITAMAQQKSLSLYHLHIIYDTINFTTVSNIAAMSCVYDTQLESKRVRYYTMTIFGLLYLGFTIMLGVRLNDWNNASPGRCYSASRVALPNAKHPLVDQVYLGVTSFYVYCLMVSATILCRIPSERLYYQKTIVTTGTLQFLLHVYSLVALRISNEPLLDNAALENEWGFGQVVAVMMLAATLLECARGFEEYFSWKRKETVSSGNAMELNALEQGVPP